ncbi:hypothetical protein BABA_18881 [Neobacillus bataviensis LMG 21833]|uniref:Uncharacterized protein n=1 Tax=Neobacillus bataviensis LMG 21833 TaxID=1117379 RepID=K6CZN0_9BACI|nr:hypothetical protein [Neobacillus bataviensis]EKN65687.1 hypothetical protein BABA_18881 [Neobacillus bataviensis LMG 21833]
MGLYINKRNHPEVYKNEQNLNESNQSFSRQDFLAELISDQQKANNALNQALAELGLRYSQQEESKVHQWNQIDTQLKDLRNRLEKNEEANQQLAMQMNEQLELQKTAAEKMEKQEELQGSVLKRLDNQDALLDKLARQVNHIRSILFERTNYLASKIDDGYKLTSSYVYKLMTGSEKPLTFFLMNHKNEESQKKADSL